MRPYFKPLLVPTLWLIPLLIILCGLGTWQIQRLHWKEGLLAKIHVGLTAPPVSVGDAYGDALDYGDKYAHMDQADYKRVFFRGHFLNNQEILFFTTGPDGQPVYHVLTPFFVSGLWDFWRCGVCGTIKNGVMHLTEQPFHHADGIVIVDRGYVPTTLANAASRKSGELEGERVIVGIIRQPSAPNWFTPPVDIAHRIVHTRDPQTLAKAFGIEGVFPMFLEADATPNAGGWPKGGVTVVDLPNDHLQYAITWFGLALGLLAVYLAYHVSRGRLGLR